MSHPLTDRDLHEQYDEMLSEIYGEVEICGLKYDAARALKEIDPIAYRCGFNDWLDSQCQDGQLFEHNDEYFTEEQEVSA